MNLCAGKKTIDDWPPTRRRSIHGPLGPPYIGLWTCNLYLSAQGKVKNEVHHLRGVNQGTGRRLPFVGGLPRQFLPQHGSFLKDPWLVYDDVFPDVSNPNMIVYDSSTTYVNFIQNSDEKLDETCLDTQGYFKAHLLNVIDVLKRVTSKPNET